MRTNSNVSLQYLGAWLAGNGCVPINNLMEDAATAEISRSQIWQWIRSPKGVLEDGRKVTLELVRTMLREELGGLSDVQHAEAARYAEAASLFEQLVDSYGFNEFLTEPAYADVAAVPEAPQVAVLSRQWQEPAPAERRRPGDACTSVFNAGSPELRSRPRDCCTSRPRRPGCRDRRATLRCHSDGRLDRLRCSGLAARNRPNRTCLPPQTPVPIRRQGPAGRR